MKRISNWNLSTRLNVILGLVLLCGFTLLTGIVLKINYDNSIERAEEIARLTAKAYAQDIQSSFNVSKAGLDQLSRKFLQDWEQGVMTRARADEMLKDYLEHNDRVFEIYTAWEPDAFDSKDSELGRFAPWWIHLDGELKSLQITDYDDPNAEWYVLPKQTGKPIWLDPYLYPIENKDVLITSIVIPLMAKDGTFLGVLGIDYDMTELQELVKSIKPHDGLSTLLTRDGIYIVHGGDDKRNGKPFDLREEIIPYISKGLSTELYDYSDVLKTKVKRVFEPISIQGIEGYWSYQSVIPVSSMMGPFQNIMMWAITLSALLLLLVLAIITFVIRSAFKPLNRTIKLVEEVSKGNLSIILPNRNSAHDEIGRLASATQVMIGNLRELFEGMEAQNEEIIAQNEEIQSQNEEIRDQNEKTEGLLKERDQLFELSHDMIAAIGFDGKLLDLNPSWEKTLGFTKKELMSQPISSIIHPDYLLPIREVLSQLLQGYIPIHNLIIKMQCKDGSYRTFALSAASEEKSRLAYAILRDITDDQRIQDELLQAKNKAEAANLAKSDFLASMSHEIRTPMNAIIGMSDLLYETKLTQEQQTYVESFRKAGENLLHLINDILDFSKVEAGLLQLESTEFNLEDLVEKTMEILSNRAHSKGLEFLTRIAPDVPRAVLGDPGRLRQVLFNLIGNAIKFTSKGEIIVQIERAPEGSNPNLLRFTVTDTGIGIPIHKLDNIFEKFTQADSSTTREYGGSGLGLAISRKIVDLMGGSIGVESEEGRGSTFYFTAMLQETDMPLMNNAYVPLTGLRVLIVDDNKTNLMILTEILGKYSMRLSGAESGAEGLKLFKTAIAEGDPFDLLIIDNHMPLMNGFDMVSRMGEGSELKDTTIMMLTSDDQAGNIERCRDLGLASYLVKPIKKNSLMMAISKALAGNRPDYRDERSLMTTSEAEDYSSRTSSKKHILLVEDNEDNRLLIKSFLKKTLHTFDIAENGEIGLRMRKEGAYDLILMDMQMPVMDGYDATREIRLWEELTDAPRIPIIALTAHALKEDMQLCMEAGCDSYLTKPIKKLTLFDEINRHGRS